MPLRLLVLALALSLGCDSPSYRGRNDGGDSTSSDGGEGHDAGRDGGRDVDAQPGSSLDVPRRDDAGPQPEPDAAAPPAEAGAPIEQVGACVMGSSKLGGCTL